MGQALRILLVEDSEDDSELLLRELRKAGYIPKALRVATADAMRTALAQQEWDVIISDYVIPGFGGMEALALYQETDSNAPFLVVSGHIGEEIAVAAMQAGADDYLMKDRLARLVPALERALSQAEIRRAHVRANEALKESEERFRQLAENIGAVFFMFEKPTAETPGIPSYVSPAFEKIWGLPCESLMAKPDLWLKAIEPQDAGRVHGHLSEMSKGNFSAEFRILRMDLEVRWVHLRTFPVRNEQGVVYRVAAIGEDITARKRSEEQLAANARQLQNSVNELRFTEEELRRSNEELQIARTDLEKRVQERTAALAEANLELREQMSERRRLENELLEIAENERRRIGFDLHDDLGQKLMGVSLLLKALETNLQHKNVPEAVDTRNIQALIHEVINHTHNLARCFSSLDSSGEELGKQLESLAANVRNTFKIACRFRVIGEIPKLASDATLQFYKIAQESVSNAIKHGKAKRISVMLVRHENEVMMRIKNDGVPIQEEREPTNRLGLRIMNYRAKLVGGAFEIRPNGGSGSLVICSLKYANGHKTGRPSIASFSRVEPARSAASSI